MLAHMQQELAENVPDPLEDTIDNARSMYLLVRQIVHHYVYSRPPPQ